MNILLIIIIILVIYIIWYLNLNILQQTKHIIYSHKLPKAFDECKIVHLSDLHLKEFGKNNCRLIKKINNIKPDIIVITGDMVCKRNNNYSVLLNLLNKLKQNYPVYYSLGNHEIEQESKDLEKLKEQIKLLGVNLLSNEYIDISRKGENIRIYGMDFKLNMDFKNTDEILKPKYYLDMESTIGKLDKSKYNILLAHDPLNYELYDKFGFDLVFSGHIHGGAIRLFGKGLFSPRRTLFPKYSANVTSGKNGKIVVSRGLGDHSLKLRLFNLPEIVTVILKNR